MVQLRRGYKRHMVEIADLLGTKGQWHPKTLNDMETGMTKGHWSHRPCWPNSGSEECARLLGYVGLI